MSRKVEEAKQKTKIVEGLKEERKKENLKIIRGKRRT